ncbi:hypothetical protein C8J56DRAFT_277801 [Mycena floridula]|nr:hypothetical protein C8J56DRAFT_277801 [Mycena floridula]
MTTFTSFAVVGAGSIGQSIAQSLSATGSSVIVISRSEVKSIDGVKTIVVDTSKAEAVTQILKQHNVEVVLSTLGSLGLVAVQKTVAEASKAAGVKLFVPSEYGIPSHGYSDGFLKVKDDQLKYAQSLGLPTVAIYVGFFMGTLKYVTAFAVNGKVNIVGNETATGSFTAESDIAGFTAHILTTLPPSQLENKIFRIEGQHGSMLDVAKAFGTTVTISDPVPGPMSDFATFLQKRFAAGACYDL